jgi:flagellar basal body-associated protein FliL
MAQREIEPGKKNKAFLVIVLAAIVVAIAGIAIATHVHRTTNESNVPGQHLK